MKITEFQKRIQSGALNDFFSRLYSTQYSKQIERYLAAIDAFQTYYSNRDEIRIFSASGRTEIGGNHTDHQKGCVLGATVDLDIVAVVSLHQDGVIRVKSEGYPAFRIRLDSLEPQKEDHPSAAMIRGILYCFSKIGVSVSGFDLYCTSAVPGGSGVSSSAAFEILIATVINSCYHGGKATPMELAKMGQFSENVYFGKKSGLLDQSVCSVGGLVSIDFQDSENPKVDSFSFDFAKVGYDLFITDTKGSHADLTDNYVAIRYEMESVANHFNKNELSKVSEQEFYNTIAELRNTCSDRAILRAMHFFDETSRAKEEVKCLKNSDIKGFLRLVNESGQSSELLLQNLYSTSKPTEQALGLAIHYSKRILQGRGAVRVHGGGFAGTIQAFVPRELSDFYQSKMDQLFGENACHKVTIRPCGGIELV